MILPNNISVLNEIVSWKLKITNGPTNNVGVLVTLSIPPGWNLLPGEVLGQGTLGGLTWTIGSMTPGQIVYGEFNLQKVTNLLGQPWNFIATVFGLDTNPGDNILTDTVLLGSCPTCPPAAGAVPDPFACLCGSVAENDTICTSGTTSWQVVPGSEVNVTILFFDTATGRHYVRPIDPYLPWSFQYSIWCDDGSGPLQISGPALVSGPAQFVSYNWIPRLVKEDFTTAIGGTTVTLAVVPIPGYDVFAYRNGIEQPFSDYSVAGNIVTFTTPFGPSSGGVFGEGVSIHYHRTF